MFATSPLHSPRGDNRPFGGGRLPVPEDRVYHGRRDGSGGVEVWSVDRPEPSHGPAPEKHALEPRLEIRSHSPAGFAWGYGGSGPAQLALALLADALGDTELAEEHYQAFKFAYVATWGDSWSITAREIRDFVRRSDGKPARSEFEGFRAGAIVATANAIESLSASDIRAGLQRHLSGDWGELDREDWAANERALRDGARLLSAYTAASGQRFWIITEWDRHATTVLLPEDY